MSVSTPASKESEIFVMDGSVVRNRGDKPGEDPSGKRKKTHSYNVTEDLSLWTRFNIPIFGEIRFNPVVSFTAIFLIWSFVGICSYFKEEVPFAEWKGWLVEYFTWLYIGSQDIWAIFIVVLYCSKYSNIKLGKDSDVPEYSDPTWFMMLFACGIGTGLFFFGVAEPLFHYTGANRYSADPTLPDNTLAQIAINITLYHWGIHGWIVYSLVGLLLALLSYREGLPMTMKSCFYPLIGDRVFGWIGDVIDIISIITTLFGVCTSLGLGTRQLNVGLTLLNSNILADDITIQVIIIWCITAVATISTVSGVGMGIRRLSETCFIVGMFLMIVALFMDNTFFILNLYVQSIGYYFQKLIQLGFHTDAFEQLGHSYGASDRGRFTPEDVDFADGPDDWMDGWTMFYWGWWISWCPFVGMFIAKISKGRTIKQFINGTLTAPVLYSFIWLVIFGGAGLRLERSAGEAGLCCPDKTDWFIPVNNLTSAIADQNVEMSDVIDAGSSDWMCISGACGSCANTTLYGLEGGNSTYDDLINMYRDLGKDFGSVSADRTSARLSCHQTEQMWFDVMRSYGDIGSFLSMFSLLGIILYFVTSSDSGSLVIDCLSANGDPDPPRLQRVFWALMEGATATALLVAGGKEGLLALQAAGLLSGLPYTFLVCLICTSIWRACKVAAGDLDPNGPDFACGLFDPFAPQPYKYIGKYWSRTVRLFMGFVKNIFLAPFTVAKVAERVYQEPGQPRKKQWFTLIAGVAMFALFILFHLLQLVFNGSWAIAWFFYLGFGTIMCSVRIRVRELFEINGNAFEDLFAALLMYPACALQMDETTKHMEDVEKIDGPGIGKDVVDNGKKPGDLENGGSSASLSEKAGAAEENLAYVDEN